MLTTLILVSGDFATPLSTHDLCCVNNSLSYHHIAINHDHWLHPNKAVELDLSSPLTTGILFDIRAQMSARLIDVFYVTGIANRQKRLLLADMDATIVEGETLDDLAEKVGLKDKISTLTARAMIGELDFQSALAERVAMLKNLPVAALTDTLSAIRIHQGAKDVVRVMQKNGAKCYLVSGGFTYFTGAIAEICGFNGHHGNILEIKEGVLTGKVLPPILDKEAKLSFLRKYRAELGLSRDDTLAVGDGSNDLPMLTEAGLGVGFHPKPIVKEKIDNCIIHTDLTSLLYIQGYTWQDIAT